MTAAEQAARLVAESDRLHAAAVALYDAGDVAGFAAAAERYKAFALYALVEMQQLQRDLNTLERMFGGDA